MFSTVLQLAQMYGKPKRFLKEVRLGYVDMLSLALLPLTPTTWPETGSGPELALH
jgi:hypothetical protein